MKQTVIALVILFVSIYLLNTITEGFMPYLQFGTKRLMSHDLRGDPYIPFVNVSPWNQPTVFPIRNREIF